MWCISGLHGLCLSCPMAQKARSLDHNVLRHTELLLQCIPALKSNRAYEQPEARLPGCYAAHPSSAGAKHVLGKQLQEYSATTSQYAHLALNIVPSEPQDTSNYDRCWTSIQLASRAGRWKRLLCSTYSTANNVALIFGLFSNAILSDSASSSCHLPLKVSQQPLQLSAFKEMVTHHMKTPSLWEDFKAVLCTRRRWRWAGQLSNSWQLQDTSQQSSEKKGGKRAVSRSHLVAV